MASDFGKLISDTKELVFDPAHARFVIHTPYCGYFSGSPAESLQLSEKIEIQSENERITLALLPVGKEKLEQAEEFVITAMGTTGIDKTTYQEGAQMMGFPFTAVHFQGKLYAETLEGRIYVKVKEAVLTALDPTGNEIGRIEGKETEKGVCFLLPGNLPSVQYNLKIKKECPNI